QPLAIRNLAVARLDEFVVLKGETDDAMTVKRAGEIAASKSSARVVNMIRVAANHDADVLRAVERELAQHRSFDDCRLAVACERGIVRISGSVRSESQADAVRAVLRNVPGVERVETSFARE